MSACAPSQRQCVRVGPPGRAADKDDRPGDEGLDFCNQDLERDEGAGARACRVGIGPSKPRQELEDAILNYPNNMDGTCAADVPNSGQSSVAKGCVGFTVKDRRRRAQALAL